MLICLEKHVLEQLCCTIKMLIDGLSAAATACYWTASSRGSYRHINQCEQFAEACQNVNPNTFISLQMNTHAPYLNRNSACCRYGFIIISDI